MAIKISNSAAAVGGNAVTKRLDAGHVHIRTSSQPSEVASSAHGALLVSANFAAIAFVSARDANPGALCSANGIAEVSSLTSGKAGWFRAYTSAGIGWMDGTVTSAAASGDMIMDNVDVEQDVPVNITSFSMTFRES